MVPLRFVVLASFVVAFYAFLKARFILVYSSGSSATSKKYHFSPFQMLDIASAYMDTFGLSHQNVRNSLFIIAPSSPKKKLLSWYFSRIGMHVAHTESALTMAEIINRRKPDAIVVYSTCMCQLTRLKERCYIVHDPSVIVLVAEWLSDAEWIRAQRAWRQTRLEQLYGASELAAIASRQRDGTYRLFKNVTFHPKENVFTHHRDEFRSDDSIRATADGSLVVRSNRYQYEQRLLEKGLELMDSTPELMCFQVQIHDPAVITVAFHGNVDEQLIKVHFAVETVLPVSAVRGEAAFKRRHTKGMEDLKVGAIIR